MVFNQKHYLQNKVEENNQIDINVDVDVDANTLTVKSKVRDSVAFKAYLTSKKNRYEVYRRLADS